MCSSAGSVRAVNVIVPGVSVTALATSVVVSSDSAVSRTLTTPDRNAAGELVGNRKLVTQRMAWSVEQQQYLQSLDRQATLLRSGALEAGAIVTQYPELTGAVVGMKLAEQFARRLTPRPDDQARIVEAIRTGLAEAIAQGRQIRLPARQVHAHAQPQLHRRGRSAPSLDEPQHSRT